MPKSEQQELFTLENFQRVTSETGFLVSRESVRIAQRRFSNNGSWAVWMGLQDEANLDSEVRVNINDFVLKIGVSRGTFFRSICACVDAGLIERTATGYRLIGQNWSDIKRSLGSNLSLKSDTPVEIGLNSDTPIVVSSLKSDTRPVDNPVESLNSDTDSRPLDCSFKNKNNTNTKNKPTSGVLFEPSFPEWLPMEAWAGFVEMRKRIKAPLTGRAISLSIGTLERLRAAGSDPGKVLDQSTEKAWRGLFEVRLQGRNGNGNGHKSSNQQTLDDSAEEVGRRIRERAARRNDSQASEGDNRSDAGEAFHS